MEIAISTRRKDQKPTNLGSCTTAPCHCQWPTVASSAFPSRAAPSRMLQVFRQGRATGDHYSPPPNFHQTGEVTIEMILSTHASRPTMPLRERRRKGGGHFSFRAQDRATYWPTIRPDMDTYQKGSSVGDIPGFLLVPWLFATQAPHARCSWILGSPVVDPSIPGLRRAQEIQSSATDALQWRC